MEQRNQIISKHINHLIPRSQRKIEEELLSKRIDKDLDAKHACIDELVTKYKLANKYELATGVINYESKVVDKLIEEETDKSFSSKKIEFLLKANWITSRTPARN